LRAASLNPWIDKENLLPGQDKNRATKKAIRESDYFIALLSTISVQARGDVQSQISLAKKVLEEIPEPRIFFIPTRLDNVDIPYEELRQIQSVDMFPNWEEGLKRILESIKVDQKQIDLVIEHQHINSPFTSSDTSPEVLQTQTFKGEKQFFVGRQNYINQIIKDNLRVPGSKVSIVGPGGSGKSQLAFKAMHEYIRESIFDLVIPIYFDEGLIAFDKFLLQIAEIFGMKADDFELNNTIERHKNIIRDLLDNRKHPLIYLDNFETVSWILNSDMNVNSEQSRLNARQITDFLNNTIPADNTSILVTSRERKNNLSNELITDLEGLGIEDSMKLFNAFIRPVFKDPKGEIRDQIEDILIKIGGHPLSIEIIAKNLRGFHELKSILQNLGGLKGDPTQAEERFRTLQACFGSTTKRLDDKLQELLPKLTLFKSPFPISAAVEILNANENEILDLYDRSLLKLVDSDESYGKVQDPEYWLYNFHLAIRSYVEDTMSEKEQSYHDLEIKYGEKLSTYYYNLLKSTYYSFGMENHVPSLARFTIIHQGDNNDFDRAIELAADKTLSAYISSYLGLIMSRLGMLSKALEYHTRSLEIYEQVNDRNRMTMTYKSKGIVLRNMGRLEDALEYHKKALEIDEKELKDRVEIAGDYTNIGLVLGDMGRLEEALEYQKMALEIDERELNDRVGMALDYGNIGLVLWNMGRLEEALEYQKMALEIHDKELNDRVGVAGNYKSIGLVLWNMGGLEDALEYHKKALEIDEKELNDRVGMALDYGNIGLVLGDMGRHEDALEYYEKALEIHETELKDRVEMARDYTNIGGVLMNTDRLEEALEYHKKALEIHEELNDIVRMARDYANIGLVLKNLKKTTEAVKSVDRGLIILLELETKTGYHYPLIETLKEIRESLDDRGA
jgi:tetratricopeptide (TPR) repeat protein